MSSILLIFNFHYVCNISCYTLDIKTICKIYIISISEVKKLGHREARQMLTVTVKTKLGFNSDSLILKHMFFSPVECCPRAFWFLLLFFVLWIFNHPITAFKCASDFLSPGWEQAQSVWSTLLKDRSIFRGSSYMGQRRPHNIVLQTFSVKCG